MKVLVSGLCGAQLHEIRGHKGNEKFLPHPMGHEGCGIVEEVGPGVTTVKVGDKVVVLERDNDKRLAEGATHKIEALGSGYVRLVDIPYQWFGKRFLKVIPPVPKAKCECADTTERRRRYQFVLDMLRILLLLQQMQPIMELICDLLRLVLLLIKTILRIQQEAMEKD